LTNQRAAAQTKAIEIEGKRGGPAVRLAGKAAIVTGGGKGIGRTIALTFAREGARVAVAGRAASDLDEVAREGKRLGAEMLPVPTDVTREEDVAAMVDRTLGEFGGIDILVNNAGAVVMAPAESMTVEQWDSVLDVNLKGPFLCCRAVAREMIKKRSGKIVNVSSGGGHLAIPCSVSYAASKAGLLLLTKALAVEWGKYHINVNSVSPGITVAGMFEKFMAENPEEARLRQERIPLREVNRPEDIANAVLFLVSAEADRITGEDIAVDGGMLSVHPGYVHMV
jgi:NAD(P)-dependent dehydrogenase (short-subunit alcohol dehydrogenase family)